MSLRPPAVLALILATLFAGLGQWQLDRARLKQGRLDQQRQALEERHARPLAVAAEAATDAVEWAHGWGRFDGPVLLLDNQVLEGRAGVRVYRPFRPEGARRPVLVELGWLALPPDRRLPETDVPEGGRKLSGLLAPPPAVGLRLGPAGQRLADGRWLLTRLDPAELAGPLGLAEGLSPRVLRPGPEDPIGYRRLFDAASLGLPPAKHRGYALQWFALATAAVAAAVLFARRRETS